MQLLRAALGTCLTVAALAGAASVGGCQRSYVPATIDTNYPASDVSKELEFWHELPSRSAVCNDEGLHGLILLADGEDNAGSYAKRVEIAKERGWVGKNWNEAGNMAMQRGTLASAVCQICKIKGGVMMRLAGPIPRYATRELVFMRIMGDPSTENLSITGLEYVGVISKAQDYVTMNGAPPAPAAAQPAPQAPAEPPAAAGDAATPAN